MHIIAAIVTAIAIASTIANQGVAARSDAGTAAFIGSCTTAGRVAFQYRGAAGSADYVAAAVAGWFIAVAVAEFVAFVRMPQRSLESPAMVFL